MHSSVNGIIRKNLHRKISLFALIVFPLLYAWMGILLGQDVNWDLRNYHFYNPWAFVTGRYAAQTDFMPSQIQYFFNPLLDVPLYFLVSAFPLKAAQFIWGWLQGLNFVLLFFIAQNVLKEPDEPGKTYLSLLLAVLGMSGVLSVSLSGTTINDNVTSLGILLSVLLLAQEINKNPERSGERKFSKIFFGGLPAGIATGLKLTCAPYCIGIFIAFFFIKERDFKNSIRSSAFLGAGLAAGFLLSYGYWGWFLYSQYSNPFFPFFNHIFQSPLWSSQNLDVVSGGNFNIVSLPLLIAKGMMMEGLQWKDFRITAFLYLAIPCLFTLFISIKNENKSIVSRPAALFLVTSFIISYVVWYKVFLIYRYLFPLECIAPLLILCCLSFFNFKRKWQMGLASLVIFAFISLSVSYPSTGRKQDWAKELTPNISEGIVVKNGAMIVMTGEDGYSHLLPWLPFKASYVRLEIKKLSPEGALEKQPIISKVKERIHSHGGEFYLLVAETQKKDSEGTLKKFHLSFMREKNCAAIENPIYTPAVKNIHKRYLLCRLKKNPAF